MSTSSELNTSLPGAVATVAPEERATLLSGWGRTAPTAARLIEADSAETIAAVLRDPGPRGALPRGLGRSYGDAAQNAGGRVLDMTALDRIHDVDIERARVTVDAGVSLLTLAKVLIPLGLFVHVTPGTAHVTVGGAIACDVHGKSHHVDGSFCDHLLAFELLTPSGERVAVTRETQPELFEATAGGMGLTGVVLSATLALIRIETGHVVVDRERARDLDDVMARMLERDDQYRYSVAWIDCLARGARLGRSVLMRGDHATPEQLGSEPSGPPVFRAGTPLAAPAWTPPGLLRRFSVGAFNEAYYRLSKSESGRIENLRGFFYPLDSIGSWNRIYGPGGFVQYQLAVPYGAEDTLRTVLERLSAMGAPSFLAVLKRLGPQRGMLSFPIEGWTLALDVPATTPGLGALLDELDELVAEAGGRVYLAKDSRLRPDVLAAMYPRIDEWRAARDRVDPAGVMRSDLSRRLELA